MSIYEDLVDDVVEHLNKTGPNTLDEIEVKARKLEDTRGQYRVLEPKVHSRVGVSFAMHRFGTEKEPTDYLVGQAGQTSDLYIMCSVAGRKMYGEGGVLQIIERINKNLIGFQCEANGTLSAFSSDLLTFVENTWYWEMLFRIHNFIMIPNDDNFAQISEGIFHTYEIDEGTCERDIEVPEGTVTDENGNTLFDQI